MSLTLTLLKSKLHRATVTDANLTYDGSIGIPRDLMDAANFLPAEQVDVLNANNGERFTTYIIELPAGSAEIVINGPAARKAQPGDQVIICAYASMPEAMAKTHRPRLVLLGANNSIREVQS
jgi:aspartate 1-decarboxylase